MRVLLRRLEPQAGQPVAVEQRLSADRLTIGRGTKQLVEIADLRVALAHAEISPVRAGVYLLKTIGSNSVLVNGAVAQLAELQAGDTVDIGRFRLTIAPPDADSELVLQIEERLSAREEKTRRPQQFVMTLAQAGTNKRRPAWLLAGAILVLGLVAPLLLRHLPFTEAEASLDRIWQAGEPSAAHSHFLSDCNTCHERPFVRVRNEACLQCHRELPQHSEHADILAMDGFVNARCGACHLEHTGAALIARKPALCTGCHAAPDDDFALAQLSPAKNFERSHPEFTVRLPQMKQGVPAYAEFAHDAALREQSNLLFPHDLHVSAKGIGSPAGRKTLNCADCHQPAGRSFAPVQMEQHCLECHRLDFDPNTPALRLPHTSAAQVAKIIRDHFARVALAGEAPAQQAADAPEIVRVPRRSGEVLTAEQSAISLSWADSKAGAVIDEAIGRRVCRECHEVQRMDRYDDPWSIAPVGRTASFLTGARFDHAAHRAQDCGDCHAAEDSASSADVLIPNLASCRGCHGDSDSSGLVPTACVGCHGFHIAARARFGQAPPQ
jgi:predicted CXXCH cytochrome family protein